MNTLISKVEKKKILYVMIFFLILSYINSFMYNIWLPWSANVVFASAPIFYIGYCYKQNPIKLNVFLLILCGVLIVIISYLFKKNYYDMKHSNYGYPLITLFSSLILILNIKQLSILFSKVKIIKKPFSEIGKASLVIMYLHQPIQILINKFLTHDNSIRFLVSTLLSYVVYLIFSRFIYSRAFYLGSFPDLNKITNLVFLKRTKKIKDNRIGGSRL